jgi:hypothetical protein
MGYQTPVQQQPQYQQPPQFQQPGQMQQPMYPQAVNQPKKLPVKLLLIVVGGVLTLLVIGLLLLSLLGGGGLDTARFSDEEIAFSVELPVDWNNRTISVASLDLVRSRPEAVPATDETSLSVSRSDLRGQSADEYRQLVERRIENLREPETQALFGYSLSEIQVIEFGSDEAPAYRIDYVQNAVDSEAVHTVAAFYIYEQDTGYEIGTTALYSEEYSAMGGTIEKIVESYQLN